MISPTTRRLAITATVTVALSPRAAAPPLQPDAPASTAAGFGHVHGIVDAGDSTVLLGTHTGLYTLARTAPSPARSVASTWTRWD